MTDFQRYVIEEHIEDFQSGLISRRELLRRVTLITGTVAASAALLEAAGCSTQPAAQQAPAPESRQASTPKPYATPPAQPTKDGVTVQPGDPRIRVAPLPVTGADGAELISYYAAPTGPRAGGVVVVHENRGLVTHIQDVVRRLATAGFSAVSVDLLSRQGGADKLSDAAAYAAALSKQDPAVMVSDLRQAATALSGSGVGDKLGMTGFCFGGGMVWNALASGVPVKAAVPFYGPPPDDPSKLSSTQAAVFAIYAEQDTRITGSRDQMAAALARDGHPYQIKVYPGVDHAFHNDTGPRYNATQAEAAWIATIEWFQRYVV